MNRLKQIQPDQLKPGESLCDYCTAKCCGYFALSIACPETKADFDYLRWYLLHEHATLFAENDDWYLLVHTACKHIQADNRCGIYETRPQICRDYQTTECEYDDNFTYDRYFETAEQITEYANALFFDPATFRSPQPGLNVLNGSH